MMCCNTATDAHQIQLQFHRSLGNVTPIDLEVMKTFVVEINTFTRRAKASALCAFPGKHKATMGNESSTSYMSCHMYEIAREIASVIGNYLWMKPERSVCEEYDRISNLDIVTFNLNSRNPTPNTGGIIQMAATLLFSTSKPFLNISQDEKNHNEAQITGFWIDLFKESIVVMPINTTYKLVPFYDSDDQLFMALARRTLDVAIGLTVMTKKGFELIEFSYPYFKVGPILVMKEKPEPNQVFSFMMPFTNEMWFTLVAMTVFNAFVIRLVESRTGHESVGAIFWFPLATLFYGGHRKSPKSNLTYFVFAPWLVLILSSSCLVIEDLKKTNAIVGCDMEDSIMLQHLVESIGFQRKNIKHIAQSSIDDYAKALSTGNIKAAFLWAPYSSLFLIFSWGSPIVFDMSEAILRLYESGKIKQMKDYLLSFPECLFILSGTTSAIVMLIVVIRQMRKRWEEVIQGMLMGKELWVVLTVETILLKKQNF
ncbi:hypothetical protein ES288_D03G027700v1 [Gossypium darwinii]|uniref:Uncharacterized protein n=1 Tax=Gossypium darwinii TaxID=34276 RepID=A0A5D2D4G5_GOSDA|nr:hypothetical protein ES288_D03G027700v1 [Gossypium darwinii]